MTSPNKPESKEPRSTIDSMELSDKLNNLGDKAAFLFRALNLMGNDESPGGSTLSGYEAHGAQEIADSIVADLHALSQRV